MISETSIGYSKNKPIQANTTSINIVQEVPMPRLKKIKKLRNIKVPWALPDGRKRKKNTTEEKENVVRKIMMHHRKNYQANAGLPIQVEEDDWCLFSTKISL